MATTNTSTIFVPPKKKRFLDLHTTQAFQPKFRSQLPVPTERKQKNLVRERDEFMFRLERERREREELEIWAVVKIQVRTSSIFTFGLMSWMQATFRGYRIRPKPPMRRRKRKHKSSVARIKEEVRFVVHEYNHLTVPSWQKYPTGPPSSS
jgi:hypothetical protein